MKLSTKTRYGLRFLLDLALYGGDRGTPVAMSDTASRQGLSEKYLWQVAAPLKAAGIVRAFPGARGGYTLNRPLEEITVLSIAETMEGEVALVDCDRAPHGCDRALECVVREVWQGISQSLAAAMAAITLADITARARQQAPVDYCI